MAFESLSMKMETPDLPDSLSEDIMQKFESGNDLGELQMEEMSSGGNFVSRFLCFKCLLCRYGDIIFVEYCRNDVK